jgi:hypothetical protein
VILPQQGSLIPTQIAREKTVITPVLIHCNFLSDPSASYSVTQVYDNIESHLDYRELPNLTMLPIFIGV